MANSLSPAFVRINYVSAFGPHVMTIPSVAVDQTGVDVDSGNWFFQLRGAEIPVGVDGAIKDYVNLLKVEFPSTTLFVDYVVYQQPTPEDVATPVWSAALNIAGTGTGGFWNKATQETWTFRAEDFTLFKIVLLDAITNTFNKETAITGARDAIRDYVIAPESWLSSRGGGRPATFLQLATTLNEKLRRAYQMN